MNPVLLQAVYAVGTGSDWHRRAGPYPKGARAALDPTSPFEEKAL
jgi:hypothetical protein